MALTETALPPGRMRPWEMVRHPDMRRVILRFGPAVLGLLALSAWLAAWPLTPLLGFAFGALWWTFLEYLLHRYVLHWEPQTPRWQRVRVLLPGHRSHHDVPHDPDDVVTRKHLMAIPLCLILFGAMRLAGYSTAFGLAALAGGAMGYIFYEYVHFATHQLRPRSWLMKRLRQHHGIHHHRDETVNFGVTTWIWDRVFGTLFRPARQS